MLTGASALALPACSHDAPNPGDAVVLTTEERERLQRFAEAYVPTAGTSLKPLSEVPVVDNIGHAFSLMDADVLEQVRIGLKLFDYGSVVIGLHLAQDHDRQC